MGVVKENRYDQSNARKFYCWLDKNTAEVVVQLADGRPLSEFIRRIVAEWLETKSEMLQ